MTMIKGAIISGLADSWRMTLSYGFAHLGKSLFWYSSELLFIYYLTEFAGLPMGHMGIVIATGFVISAVIDLAMGFGLGKWLTHASGAGRLQLIGAICCSISLAAVFSGIWVRDDLRFGYALVAGMAFRLSFAAYDIPQNALMALATHDSKGRQRIASTRIWFSGIATLIVAAIVGPLIAHRTASDAVLFLLSFVALFAIMAIGSAWRLARLLHSHRPAQSHSADDRPHPARLSSDFWLLLIVMVSTSAFTPIFGKLEPYFASYTLKSAWWGGVAIVLMAVGVVAGQPLWVRLCARMTAGAVMALNGVIQILALALFWAAGASSPMTSAIAAFFFGIGNGGIGMVQWAAFSETISRLSPRRIGLYYAMFAATGKISLAAGGLMLANALAKIEYRGTQGAALVEVMAILPAIGALIGIAAGLGLSLHERGVPARAMPAAASGRR